MIEKIHTENKPQHIAIIMDGNGRWAKQQGKLRVFGHEAGAKAVRKVIRACSELQIPFLTLYTFSTENWNRPKMEVNALMSLLTKGLKEQLHFLQENNIRLCTIGEISSLPKGVWQELQKVIEATSKNSGTTLTLALGYGGQQEIQNAVREICTQVKNNKIQIEDIDNQLIKENLYTKNIPDVDLLIRTGGEWRISNFLLWQIAYAELYFLPVYWPDFTENHLYQAITDYQNRERRFGKTSEQIK